MSVVLSEHLPLLASAPDGIQKLRGLVLELAVRGKLVPQDPNDEPASELIKRIEAERAGLEAKGGNKKSKPLPPVEESEQPFELPDGWAWGRIADVANSQAGFAFKSSAFNDVGIGLPLIRIRDVGFSCPTTFFDGPYREEFVVSKGDYLVSMDGQFRVAVWTGPDALLNQRVSRLQFFSSELAQAFFAISLHIGLAELQGIKAYTTVDHLSGGQIAAAVVGIPPLAEQHRIVAKVDELMALCDRLEAEQADAVSAHARLVETLLGTLTQSADAADLAANWQRLAEHFDTLFSTEASIDALKQTVLQLAVMGKLVPQALHDEPASELLKKIAQERTRLEMAGICKKSKAMSVVGKDEQPFEVPDGWTWVRFDEIINPEKPISYGVLVPGPEVADGVPFVRIADLSITSPPTLPEKKIDQKVDAQYSRTRLDGGEILMGVVGSIGKLGLAPRSWKGANIARAICRIVPTEHVDKPFVLQLLQSKFMQSSFVGDTRTLAQPTLNVGLIRSALTPVPPLAEQKRIVAKVDELMALCDHIKTDLATARQQQARLADTLVESALEAA